MARATLCRPTAQGLCHNVPEHDLARRVRATALDNQAPRADLLMHLCLKFGTTEYLLPIGLHDYLDGRPCSRMPG
jgi:hypothetical protein